MEPRSSTSSFARRVLPVTALCSIAAACMLQTERTQERHDWWEALGPVVPHDTFPTDCELCHLGSDWQSLTDDFEFDHELETGVALEGAHADAKCLRCHNDRGPVEVFAARGCAGCHEDVHEGFLGARCETCHGQITWRPSGQVELHARTRFPLIGVHAEVSCRRCHPGAETGRFLPVDVECLTCHVDDLNAAVNPNHVNLGLVDDCDRCHMPTTWNAAEID